MASRAMPSPPFLFLALLVLLASCSGPMKNMAKAQRTWCIARDVAEPQALQSNIDYACSKVECSIILPGGSCFCPNTLMNHASVAMNLYYKANKRNPSACNFNGTGTITFTDPSFGICRYI